MTLAELVTLTRRALRDDVGADADRYWTDTDLEEYLNEAQEEFAKRTLCLIESLDTTMCTINLTANTHSYVYSRSILRIDEVRPSWRNKPLQDVKSFRFFDSGWQTKRALPECYCTDFNSSYITIDRNPATVNGETLSLTVRRLPEKMTSSGTPQDPEIPDEYHRSLRFYANYRALDDKDNEINKPVLADNALNKWEKAISDAISQLSRKQPNIYIAKGQF